MDEHNEVKELVRVVFYLRKELDQVLASMRELVENHDYSYLDKGIGKNTPVGQRWLKARELVRGDQS